MRKEKEFKDLSADELNGLTKLELLNWRFKGIKPERFRINKLFHKK